MTLNFIVPTLSEENSEKAIVILQARLADLNDLGLTLKHAHWNVKGPNFIAVHEMLDPQIDAVRDDVDEIAERIATLGGSPDGTVDSLVGEGRLPKYPVAGRADTLVHLKALNDYYTEVITRIRKSISELDELDGISSNILQDSTQGLEQFQWFLRSHLI
jgi:starvation-inducible DNA-binding protein